MAMRKEPQRRYASAEQLADDIRRHLEGRPVIARKDTVGYRVERFVSRHRLGVAAAGFVVLALVGGIVTTTWQARVARAERARAQAALADVRKLANAFIFDVHDAIEKLPGSTPARQMVVKRALEYLDRLARDAPKDAALQLELAAAYARVGTLQWNRYLAHVGQLQGALESQGKALAIREGVSRADPGNAAAREGLGYSHLLIGDIRAENGDLAGALESYRRSLKIREELVAADPRDVAARKSLSTAHQRIGDTLGNPGFPNLGDAAGALESFGRMQAIVESLAAENPGDLDLRNRLAVGLEKRGKVLAGQGDARGALLLFRREVEVLEELSRAAPTNAEYRRNLGVAHGNVGAALSDLGDAAGALESYRRALAIREELAAADPQNRGAQRDVAWALDVIGGRLSARKDYRGAVESYGRAASIFEAILAVDPAQPAIRQRLAGTLESMASASLRLGRAAEARAYTRRSLSLRRELASRPEATAQDLNGYAWLLLTADPNELRDAAGALPPARRAVEMTKGEDPGILDTLALAYHLTGDHARAVETEEQALARLPGDGPLRRDLEANLARFRAARARAPEAAGRSAPGAR
jgi:non-specific serine/threonine protein kinase/serine/threonine-protein kinase